jgi:hypothetical protein
MSRIVVLEAALQRQEVIIARGSECLSIVQIYQVMECREGLN